MSQPVGIIAKIKLSEEAFKKFIKLEAKTIAEELFDSFWAQGFRYLYVPIQ